MYFLLNYIKKNIYFLSLFVILAIFTNSFYNFYAILKRPYEERLMWNYGFGCEKYSYGFVQKIIQTESKNQSFSIINFENMPDTQFLFHLNTFDKSKKNLILLNLRNKQKLKDYDIDLNQYFMVENLDNCYFYKKYD
tara:strand:- start:1408 stop:1818 length:411 start_codon:yes stop_codon:yes gene_type:complete